MKKSLCLRYDHFPRSESLREDPLTWARSSLSLSSISSSSSSSNSWMCLRGWLFRDPGPFCHSRNPERTEPLKPTDRRNPNIRPELPLVNPKAVIDESDDESSFPSIPCENHPSLNFFTSHPTFHSQPRPGLITPSPTYTKR
jgi:hypothetical protein